MADKPRTKVYYEPGRGTLTTATGSNLLWWESEPENVHKDLFALFDVLVKESDDRIKRNIQCARLYGNADITSFYPSQYTNVLAPVNLPESRIKYNIISSMVDTATSKIGKMKPRVSFLTSKGRWDEQRQARQLTKWVDGKFYQNDIYRQHADMFRDAGLFDVGVLKHYICNGKIVTERAFATDLFVDKLDGMYGKPSHMYHRKYARKSDLIADYPEHEDKIRASEGASNSYLRTDDKLNTHITVVEAWHLPYEDQPGKHVIAIEGCTLLEEAYEKDYFPFTFFHWAPPVVGFWGQSLADRLTGNQLEINKMLRIIQKSFHLGSAFKVFLEYGSKVARDHINNEIGSIVYYNGAAPTFYVPQTVHPEFFQFLEWLIRSSYEETGISQLSASSRKPSELESGRALREFNLIETERFATVAQRFEQSFMTTAAIYLDLGGDLYKEYGIDDSVTVSSRKIIEEIKWSDVEIGREDYIMKMYPTSLLPTEPAGRIATVESWINSGLIPPEEGLRLLDFPDIEDYRSLKDAPFDLTYMIIDELLYGNRFIPPEPRMNLAASISIMQDAYLRARVDGAPEDRLDKMRRWMEQARLMAQKAEEAKMAAMAQAQAGAAVGQGMAPSAAPSVPTQPMAAPGQPSVA